MTLQLHRLAHAMGAELSGVELREPLGERALAAVRAAFLEYHILLFRGQRLTREQHIALTRQFGEADDNDEAPKLRIPEYPQILLNKPERGKSSYTGQVWHSDQCYTLVPAMASLLRCIETPAVGGDTMFANMQLAYETLSAGMKQLIDGLHGVHFGGKNRVAPPVAQPIVRVHPETGRKSLYLGEKVKQIVGMTEAESRPLLQYLCAHAVRPQFVYRHRWQQDDLLMWDNRCVNHIALGDYDKTQVRHMERTTVKGTPSGYVFEGTFEYAGPPQ